MKIAFIVTTFPALSQTFILNQITGLIDRGHEVDIFAEQADNTAKMHPDVQKYRLLDRTYYLLRAPYNRSLRVLKGLALLLANYYKDPVVLRRSLNIFKYGKQAASLKLLYAVIPLLRKGPYHIIHCHFGPNGVKSLQLQELGALQGNLITTFYGYDITRELQSFGNHIYVQLFNNADFLFSISECMKRQLIELGCHEKKIILHQIGIDSDTFSFTPRQLHTKRRVRLVTIARLVEKKGVEYGIRAVAKLAAANQNIEYNVVGDGPLRENFQRLIQELDAGDAIKLLGWKQQQEIVEILNNADILLAPSVTSRDGDQEGTPVVLMEAMAMGLPVVSTQHSGIPELVENGVSGFLVPERDVSALVEKLGYLIEHPELWLGMGQAGRAYVEEYYNIDKLNDRLVKTYQNLLT